MKNCIYVLVLSVLSQSCTEPADLSDSLSDISTYQQHITLQSEFCSSYSHNELYRNQIGFSTSTRAIHNEDRFAISTEISGFNECASIDQLVYGLTVFGPGQLINSDFIGPQLEIWNANQKDINVVPLIRIISVEFGGAYSPSFTNSEDLSIEFRDVNAAYTVSVESIPLDSLWKIEGLYSGFVYNTTSDSNDSMHVDNLSFSFYAPAICLPLVDFCSFK